MITRSETKKIKEYPIFKNTRSQTRKRKRDSPDSSVFKNTGSQSRKRSKVPKENFNEHLDQLKNTFNHINTVVEKQVPNCVTNVNMNLSAELDDSNIVSASSSQINTDEKKIDDGILKQLENTINDNLRRSPRIKEMIEKEQNDCIVINKLESKLESNLKHKQKDKNSVSTDNTNVLMTPNSTLNSFLTDPKTPLTDLIANFIKQNNELSDLIKGLNLNDISPVYNKQLLECFNQANVTGIKIRDASCDFRQEEQQMKDIWGGTVTNHAKSNETCCYLCNVQIAPNAPPEMEHKIVCPIVFTQFLHYNILKRLYFTEDDTTSIFMLWNDFKKIKTNQEILKDLYNLINCSPSKDSYPKQVIDNKFNNIFSSFEDYIRGQQIIINNNNNEFTFYKSFIKFWLMEFAYAHHTCNQGKHHHSYNTICGINEGIKQTCKRSKSTTDSKVIKEHQAINIGEIVTGVKNRKDYLIAHFNHIKECGSEVCNNYHYISKAIQPIHEELAKNIFIVKNLRRMYQSTEHKKSQSNKNKSKKKSRR